MFVSIIKMTKVKVPGFI